MGIISNSIVDLTGVAEVDEFDEELHKALLSNTLKTANIFSAGQPEVANKLNNHMVLA